MTGRSSVGADRREGRLDGHGFSGLRLRTTRERDATRSPTAMRGNCSPEDEPGYRQLLHSPSSPRRSLRLFAWLFPAGELTIA